VLNPHIGSYSPKRARNPGPFGEIIAPIAG
jgi:hypothetical protein